MTLLREAYFHIPEKSTLYSANKWFLLAFDIQVWYLVLVFGIQVSVLLSE